MTIERLPAAAICLSASSTSVSSNSPVNRFPSACRSPRAWHAARRASSPSRPRRRRGAGMPPARAAQGGGARPDWHVAELQDELDVAGPPGVEHQVPAGRVCNPLERVVERHGVGERHALAGRLGRPVADELIDLARRRRLRGHPGVRREAGGSVAGWRTRAARGGGRGRCLRQGDFALRGRGAGMSRASATRRGAPRSRPNPG